MRSCFAFILPLFPSLEKNSPYCPVMLEKASPDFSFYIFTTACLLFCFLSSFGRLSILASPPTSFLLPLIPHPFSFPPSPDCYGRARREGDFLSKLIPLPLLFKKEK